MLQRAGERRYKRGRSVVIVFWHVLLRALDCREELGERDGKEP